MGKRARKWLVTSWLLLVLTCVCWIFWSTELVYAKPTPIPSDYREVSAGSAIDVSQTFDRSSGKPILIHFFNPDCPCSKFNIKHVKSLVSKYKDSFDFAIVVLSEKGKYDASDINDKFGLDLQISFDEDIAKKCGVISTPQAVILDAESRLFFKGNYNKARYCTDAKSDYARMAIDSLLKHKTDPKFNPLAHVAYGCALPSDKTCRKN
ncbi:MAG: AhpC/TSA family protein [Flavobacterium sp.]|nr:MAG: AhpC/TSA family protein [Flavobacterium sp.]